MVRLTRWFALIGFIALSAMIVVTCIDIVVRLLSRLPGGIGRFIPPAVPGTVDYVELTLITVAHLAIAVTFLRGTHVGVDLIGQMLPVRVRRVALRIGWAVCLLFRVPELHHSGFEHRVGPHGNLRLDVGPVPVWWYWI